MSFRGKFPDHTGQPHFRYTESAEVRRLQTMLQRIQADEKERVTLEQEIKTQQQALQAARKDAVAPDDAINISAESKPIPTINEAATAYRLSAYTGNEYHWQETERYLIAYSPHTYEKRGHFHAIDKATGQIQERLAHPLTVMKDDRIAFSSTSGSMIATEHTIFISNLATNTHSKFSFCHDQYTTKQSKLQYWTNGKEECLAMLYHDEITGTSRIFFIDLLAEKQFASHEALALAGETFYLVDQDYFVTMNDGYELQLYQFIRSNETGDIKAKFCYTLMSVSKKFSHCEFHCDPQGNLLLVIAYEKKERHTSFHLFQPTAKKQLSLTPVKIFDALTKNLDCAYPVFSNQLNCLFFYSIMTRQVMRFDCETYQLTLVLQLKENQFLKQLVLAPNDALSIIESSGAVIVIKNDAAQHQQWLNNFGKKLLMSYTHEMPLPAPLHQIILNYLLDELAPLCQHSFNVPPYFTDILERQFIAYKQALQQAILTAHTQAGHNACAEEIEDFHHLAKTLSDPTCTSFADGCAQAKKTRSTMFNHRLFKWSGMPALRDELTKLDRSDFWKEKSTRLQQFAIRFFKWEEEEPITPADDVSQVPANATTKQIKA